MWFLSGEKMRDGRVSCILSTRQVLPVRLKQEERSEERSEEAKDGTFCTYLWFKQDFQRMLYLFYHVRIHFFKLSVT